jgi:hypothetical protein
MALLRWMPLWRTGELQWGGKEWGSSWLPELINGEFWGVETREPCILLYGLKTQDIEQKDAMAEDCQCGSAAARHRGPNSHISASFSQSSDDPRSPCHKSIPTKQCWWLSDPKMRCKLIVAEYGTGRMSSSGAKPVVVSEASRGEWIPFQYPR